jgi:hypothetical protein
MTNESETIRKEVAVAYEMYFFWHLPGGTEKDSDNLKRDSKCPGRYFNRPPRGYKYSLRVVRGDKKESLR